MVIGLDEQVTYEKLAIATLGVRNGATFISTKITLFYVTKGVVLLPGNGAITSVVKVYRQVYRHNLLVNQNRLLWLKH